MKLFDAYNNVTDLYEFDYGAAPAVGASCPASGSLSGFVRHTQTVFNYGSDYIPQGTHIWNLPSSITLLDGQGNQAAQRQFGYDVYSLCLQGQIRGESGIQELANPPSSSRGNVTSDQSWWNLSGGTVGHQYCYDVAGNVVSDTDANGNVTSLAYGDPNNSYAHVTSVTLASGQSIAESMSMQYDYSTGAITNYTDVNKAATSYSYANDPLDRLTQITRPDGGTTTFSYPSLTQTVEKDDQTSANDQVLQTTTIYDDFLRPTQTWKLESGSTYLATYQFYDALGRVSEIANPIETTSSVGSTNSCSSLQCTSFGYDGLGRITSSTTPDSLVETASYSTNKATWADIVTVTDQASNTRQYTIDGLGRLTQVQENSGGASVQDSSTSQPVTTYCYTVLDQLTTVYQPIGTTCGNSSYAYQVRSFVYDSLGRLGSSTQPEYQNGSGTPGTITFAYDNTGNLIGRQDSRGERTCYAYDQLNRLWQAVYYEGSFYSNCSQIPGANYDPYTPAVSLTYGTSGNGTGVLTQISNQYSTTTYSNFDPFGRPMASSQITGGQTFPFAYTYNLAGALATETYPSGRTITTSYDGTNRAAGIGDSLGTVNTTYISGSCGSNKTGICYAPQGAWASYTYGNQLARSYTYNSRLQPTSTTDTGTQGQLLSLSYTWDGGTAATHNNGSLRGQTITTPPGTFLQAYSYDPLNRLQSMTDSAGGSTLQRNFSYDSYSNPWISQEDNGLPYNPLTPHSNLYNGYNQTPSVNPNIPNYDGSGNRAVIGTYSLQYDVENRLLWAWQPSPPNYAIEFFYDGAGQRVEKLSSTGAVTTYAYDAFGQLAAEYSSSAPAAPCTTCYLSWDQLGSTRLVTDQAGNVVSWHDFLAFGDEVPGSTMGRTGSWDAPSDTTTQRFTGQIRDDGPGLDFFNARYYSSALDQFMSPDPVNVGADLYNPESWNGYAYVMNNPFSDVDPDGLDTININTPGFNYAGNTAPSNVTPGGFSFLDFTFWESGGEPPKVSTLQASFIKPVPQFTWANGSATNGNGGGGFWMGPPKTGTRTCPAVPPHPSNASLAANASEAGKLRWLLPPLKEFVFYLDVRNGSPWDYKQQGRTLSDLGTIGPSPYQDFGNFNFGVVGAAAGFPIQELLRGAGYAQQQAGTSSPQWGHWYSPNPPYGDDPADQAMIRAGIAYYQNGCVQ